MATARFAWGIDVGNRALKAVKLVRDGERLRIDDFEVIEHETVLANAGDNKESLIQSALANFVQRHGVKGGAVAIGVSGQQSFARFIKLPPVEPKRIPEIVRFEAIQQIPFPLDDVEWSYQLFQGQDSPEVEVGIFAMRKDLVAGHIRYFTDFDLNVQVVQMSPLAIYNAMYTDGKLDGTTMVLDIGAENADLLICDNDSVWMRSIPIGGNSFTETLIKAFKLPFAKAEELKRSATTSKYARQIFQAMRPVFAELVSEIQRSIGFYASVHRESRINKLLVLGGTFKLPALQKYLQQNLQFDVERIDTLDGTPPADPKLATLFNDNVLSLVGAYGLALQAMGEGKITSSLLPASIRREKMWKDKTKWFAATAAMFAVGTGVAASGYMLQQLKHDSAAPDRQRIAEILAPAQDLDSQWSQIESSGEPDREQIRSVRELMKYRDLWARMIADVGNALPTLPRDVASDPKLIKQTPRGQRQQVVVESIASKYYADMTPVLNDSNFRRFAVDAPQSLAAPALRGGGGMGPMGGPGGMMGGPGGMMGGPGMMGGATGGAGTGPRVDPGMMSMGMQGGMGMMGGIGGGGGEEESGGQRGFVLTIRGTSPNSNTYQLIDDVVIKSLLAIQPTEQNPHLQYAVKKVMTHSVTQFKNVPSRLNRLKAEYDAILRSREQPDLATGTAPRGARPGGGAAVFGGAGAMGGGGFGGPGLSRPGMGGPGMTGPGMGGPGFGGAGGRGGAAADDPNAFKDRLLDEDVREDWEFTLVVAVVIDPEPYTPPAESELTDAEAQAAAR